MKTPEYHLNRIYITVWRSGRTAIIKASGQSSDRTYHFSLAINSLELEEEAKKALVQQGDDLQERGRYTCPPELAHKAQFQD